MNTRSSASNSNTSNPAPGPAPVAGPTSATATAGGPNAGMGNVTQMLTILTQELRQGQQQMQQMATVMQHLQQQQQQQAPAPQGTGGPDPTVTALMNSVNSLQQGRANDNKKRDIRDFDADPYACNIGINKTHIVSCMWNIYNIDNLINELNKILSLLAIAVPDFVTSEAGVLLEQCIATQHQLVHRAKLVKRVAEEADKPVKPAVAASRARKSLFSDAKKKFKAEGADWDTFWPNFSTWLDKRMADVVRQLSHQESVETLQERTNASNGRKEAKRKAGYSRESGRNNRPRHDQRGGKGNRDRSHRRDRRQQAAHIAQEDVELPGDDGGN